MRKTTLCPARTLAAASEQSAPSTRQPPSRMARFTFSRETSCSRRASPRKRSRRMRPSSTVNVYVRVMPASEDEGETSGHAGPFPPHRAPAREGRQKIRLRRAVPGKKVIPGSRTAFPPPPCPHTSRLPPQEAGQFEVELRERIEEASGQMRSQPEKAHLGRIRIGFH